ncbi:uncharacterized protein LOC110708810 [Chenopodium quinoa]|uniref:uncharacterized protein LOC110708810 n=1 Tax=Chenopodium quinoa TaxID=63459 RepID=UPI000B782C79|nr:uncharacterized protein LOC110708810 [Chenopodium quinoa]
MNVVAARGSLAQRGMQLDTICPLCGNSVESIFHMLISCEDAKRIWYLSPLRLLVDYYEGNSFREWCCSVRKSHKDPSWWNLFWSILWGVWLRRNAWVFEGRKRDVAASSSWHDQINTDAAVSSTLGVGPGGVMRDTEGDVVVSTCLRWSGKVEADVAEALAMRHALAITLDSGFNRVCLETDCLKLHNHLVKGRAPPTEFGLVVNDILHLTLRCQVCSFSFVKRAGNRVAHELAKLSFSFDDLRVWMEEVPLGISNFVMDDMKLLFD